MTTACRVDERNDVVDCQPPPFEYRPEGSYVRQLLLNAVVAVVLAATTVIVGLPLLGISA
jgi:hypothetical protein